MSRTPITFAAAGSACLLALTATPALADDEFFVISTTHNNGLSDGPNANVYTIDGDFTQDQDIGSGVGFATASASVAGDSSSVSSDIVLAADELSATTMKTDDATAFAFFSASADFIANGTFDVDLSWAIDTSIGTSLDRQFRVVTTDPFTVVFDHEALTPLEQAAGTATLTLNPSTMYRVEFFYRSLEGSGDGFYRIDVQDQPDDCPADIDGDGDADPDDINAFVDAFINGC